MDTDEYEKGVKHVSKSGESLASKLKSGLATAGKVAATGITAIAGAATTSVAGLLALADSTEEYRIAQGRLNTAFEAAGYSAETAQEAYNGFYAILGDTDTATEASQLLAQLAESEEDVATWTQIAAGVSGTFGDSLPIESLIEAANETAKVGQVTGTLADALNWVGISEDEFNAKLQACSTESQRNQLIMQTLSAQYDEASEAFYRNNEALVEARRTQAQLDETLSSLGETVSDIKNSFIRNFTPAISDVVDAFNDLIKGTKNADKQFSKAIGDLISTASDKLPDFLDFGLDLMEAIADGVVDNAPKIIDAFGNALLRLSQKLPDIVTELITKISASLPKLAETGVLILTTLIKGIANNLPVLIPTIVDVVLQIVDTLIDNAPLLIDAALQLMLGLVQGLINAIPVIVEKLPEIISSIISALMESLPLFINAGIQLFVGLVKALPDIIVGIIEQIPVIIDSVITAILDNLPVFIEAGITLFTSLVAELPTIIEVLVNAIPDIIEALIDAFAESQPQIAEAGVALFTSLITEWPTIRAELLKAVPMIIAALVEGFASYQYRMMEIGANLLRGIGQGIQSMAGWLRDQVMSLLNSIVSSAKNALGIHSPSKVFADMGKNMALGLGEGWDKEYSGIKRDIESGLNFVPGTVSLNGRSSVAGYGSSGIGAVNVYVTLTSSVNNQSEAEAVGRIIGEKAARQIRYKGGVSYA